MKAEDVRCRHLFRDFRKQALVDRLVDLAA